MTRTIRAHVEANVASDGYDIMIGERLLPTIGAAVAARLPARPRSAFLVYDAELPEDVYELAEASLSEAGFETSSTAIGASEDEKVLSTVEALLGDLAEQRFERWDPVIALGGGIIGDIAGFAAAVYKRGVPFFQAPTTLLSMVDASVGGKTGVNWRTELEPDSGASTGLVKNVFGAFHPPAAVIADVSVLRSLPLRELRCGLAECVKHAMLGPVWGDPGLMEWTMQHADAITGHQCSVVAELVARNVAIKAAIVRGDPREVLGDGRGRMALNLGHTFAHAFEGFTRLAWKCPEGVLAGRLRHGEAVGLGVLAASRCGEELGYGDADIPQSVLQSLRLLGLPTAVEGLPDSSEVYERMMDDKKAAGGKLRVVVPSREGGVEVVFDPPRTAVIFAIDSLRA